MVLIPGVGQIPNGFAQPHSQIRDGLQSFHSFGRQAVPPRQQEFRIPENSCQWVIDFMPQYFPEIA